MERSSPGEPIESPSGQTSEHCPSGIWNGISPPGAHQQHHQQPCCHQSVLIAQEDADGSEDARREQPSAIAAQAEQRRHRQNRRTRHFAHAAVPIDDGSREGRTQKPGQERRNGTGECLGDSHRCIDPQQSQPNHREPREEQKDWLRPDPDEHPQFPEQTQGAWKQPGTRAVLELPGNETVPERQTVGLLDGLIDLVRPQHALVAHGGPDPGNRREQQYDRDDRPRQPRSAIQLLSSSATSDAVHRPSHVVPTERSQCFIWIAPRS